VSGQSSQASKFDFDVAFSFLSGDLGVAHDLANRLAPLKVFVFDRSGEAIQGGDGMQRFAAVFKTKSRLTVILHRAGYGESDWTAFEEAAIQERALRTRFTSFMVVKLDASDLREWVPRFHIYMTDGSDTREQMTAVIRARAQEVGAEIRPLTAVEVAQSEMHAKRTQEKRRELYGSIEGVKSATVQLALLRELIKAKVGEIVTAEPGLDMKVEVDRNLATFIVSPRATTTVWIEAGPTNSLEGWSLVVDHHNGRLPMPSANYPYGTGSVKIVKTETFEPAITDGLELRWQLRNPKTLKLGDGPPAGGVSGAVLVEDILKGHLRRALAKPGTFNALF
jgi:hypothetical protein